MPFGQKKKHYPTGSHELLQNNYSFIFLINSLALELENRKNKTAGKKWVSLPSKMPGAH
jgi:hypothetical protein